MRRADIDWTAIGKFFGVDRLCIRRLIDPEWAERRRERVRIWDRKRSPRVKVARVEPDPVEEDEPAPHKPTAAEILAARRLIPEYDDRDLTGKFFGDPISSRSALRSNTR